MSITTSGFHNIAKPPLLLSLETTNIEEKPNSNLIDSISRTVNFVSMRNKIVGTCFLTNSTRISTAE